MSIRNSRDATIAALQRSESRYRSLVEATSAITWSCPPSGLHVEPQPQWMAFTGQTAEQMLGAGWIETIHPDDVKGAAQKWAQAVEDEKPFFSTHRIRRHDGAWRWMEVHAVPIRGVDDEIAEWFGVLVDITEKRTAEDAMRASEARYRLLHESMRDAFVQVDMDGRIVECNETFCQMLGYSLAELQRMTYVDLTPPRWHESEAAILRDQILQRGYSDIYEKEYRSKDGRVIPVELRTILARDDAGVPQTMWAMVRDVSQRKGTEDALRQARDMFAEAECIAHLGSFQYEIATRTTTWSDEVYRIYGLDPAGRSPAYDEMLAKCIHPDDAAALNETFLRAVARHEVYEFTHRIVRPDGSVRWVHDRAQPYVDANGKLLRYIGATLDITERREMEEALSHERERFQLALEAAPIAILVADAKGDIVLANPALQQLFGYSNAELLGQRIEMLLPPAQRQRHVHLRTEFQARPRARRMGPRQRLTGRDRDGNEFPVEIGLSSVVIGRTPLSIAVIADTSAHEAAIARQEQARLAAEAASEAKTRFLANISHELRTPLNAVLGLNELLRMEGMSPKQVELLDKQQAAGRHLLQVINAILDLAKIESGKDELAARQFRVDDLVRVVIGMAQEAAGAKGLRLNVNVETGHTAFIGDDTRLQQALLNYVNNAVKFSDGGTISIRVYPLESSRTDVLLRFEVRDEGVGIDPKVLARLFTPFEQADASSTRRHGGTGLGLSITRRIAEMMGGQAGAISQPGQGSTFWFTARVQPAAPEPTGEVPADAPAVALKRRHSGRRILLVEDDAVSAEIAAHILTHAGLQVSLATNGEEAVERAAAHEFDLILMDLTMPDMDGLQATRLIRSGPRHGSTPIVALTANAFAEDRARCLAVGMVDLLSKPVNAATLCSAVLTWLDADPAAVGVAAAR
ncbi:MAG TPA: PAS domain S-box protein [Rhizobacter sp.]